MAHVYGMAWPHCLAGQTAFHGQTAWQHALHGKVGMLQVLVTHDMAWLHGTTGTVGPDKDDSLSLCHAHTHPLLTHTHVSSLNSCSISSAISDSPPTFPPHLSYHPLPCLCTACLSPLLPASMPSPTCPSLLLLPSCACIAHCAVILWFCVGWFD